MKKILIVLVAILLIAVSVFVQFYVSDRDETPIPSFSIMQGPGIDFIKPLSVTCIPDSGYDFCYENSYGPANAKVMSTGWKGDLRYGYVDGANRWFYIDEVYINVKHKGDKFYKSTSTSWMSCNSGGCSATSISDGKIVLASAPASSIPPIQLGAWDKFASTTGQWWWTSVYFGWLNSMDRYAIGCYDNNDCDSGTYCDKSGNWDTWSCKVDPCLSMPDPSVLCDGFDLWSQKCVYGDIVRDQLLETNSIACGCIFQETPNICVGYDLWSQKQTAQCVEGLSKDQLIETNSAMCGYVCTAGETKSYPCTDGTPIITQRCIDNTWTEVPATSCPLNWINLEMILRGYIEDIKLYMEKLI